MALNDYEGETVAKGRWLYDGIPKSIEVVAFDCVYFYERLPTLDGREEWAPYPIGEDGRLFYLKPEGEILPLKPFFSIDAAKQYAIAQPWSVRWE